MLRCFFVIQNMQDTFSFHRLVQDLITRTRPGFQFTSATNRLQSPSGARYYAITSRTAGIKQVAWHFIDMPESFLPKPMKSLCRRHKEVKAAHERLKIWLQKNIYTVDDITSTKVVFGPRARFMAWKAVGAEWIGNDLPAGFTAELHLRLSKAKDGQGLPRVVAFGVHNSWAAIWKDGTHSADLDGSYTGLTMSLSPGRYKPGDILVRRLGKSSRSP